VLVQWPAIQPGFFVTLDDQKAAEINDGLLQIRLEVFQIRRGEHREGQMLLV
jgi:hypothetical protein